MKIIETYIVNDRMKSFGIRRIKLVRCDGDLWYKEYFTTDGDYAGMQPVESDVAQYIIDNSKTFTT